MPYSYIYILSYNNNALHVNVTDDLRDILTRKDKAKTGEYPRHLIYSKFLYYEVFKSQAEAVRRCEQLCSWHRDWKLNLIRSVNPELKDISEKLSYLL